MEEFKIGQLTKELVAMKLKEMADPCAAAANLVKNTLLVALKGMKPNETGHGAVVEDACQGGMTGLLLAEQNVAKGAVRILEAVVEVSHELNYDQTAMMQSALRGMADMQRFISADRLAEIQTDIEARFMGAGQAFSELLRERKEKSPSGHPAQ